MSGKQVTCAALDACRVAVAALCVLAAPAAAETIRYAYDAEGRLLRADYGGGKVIRFGWDQAGNMESLAQGRSAGLRVSSPVKREVVPAGSVYQVAWAAPAGSWNFTVQYTTNRRTWRTIAKATRQRSCSWRVPRPPGNKRAGRVKVTAAGPGGAVRTAISDPFTVEVVRLLSPNGGESLRAGSSHTISWVAQATRSAVARTKLFVSTDGGKTWDLAATLDGPVVKGIPVTWPWPVPAFDQPATDCRVKVVLETEGGRSLGNDVSDAVFSILP